MLALLYVGVVQFVHCFMVGDKSWLSYAVNLIDVGLTSSIGFSFLFNGLVDLGLMKENTLASFAVRHRKHKSKLTRPPVLLTSPVPVQVMLGSYALIFGAWVYEFHHSFRDGFLILYLGSLSLAPLSLSSCARPSAACTLNSSFLLFQASSCWAVASTASPRSIP
jgi:hypothetical protein